MTKNDAHAKQTVRIYSADGEMIGTTYPKRARGLVRKGRAQFVNDCDIRLIVSDVTTFTEEIKMDKNISIDLAKDKAAEPVNRLYFDAREWSFNKDCKNNVGSRLFMQGPDGIISEAYMIGNWGWDWTEIISRTLTLPKNTLNTFTFWLNGGENDNNSEVCRFEIMFNSDYENRYTYNLNRNFIKPIRKVNGWELYEIPFRTGDNEYTQLKFIAQRAYMTVMNAKDAAEYADIPDTVDPYERYRPQRHNIVFGDGWPTNTWYSTAKMEQAYGENRQNVQQSFSGDRAVADDASALSGPIMGINASLEALNNFDIVEFREQLKSVLASNPHLSADDIEEIVQDGIESVQDSISDAIDELNDALEELNDTLEEMQG
ncbi:MAG: hypothetical protein J6A16_04965 [Oscillospiraceae bacterium]|nr:hypothetical protein [Oscillospiraceae bacterium]